MTGPRRGPHLEPGVLVVAGERYPVRELDAAELAGLREGRAGAGEDLAELLEWVWDALDLLLPGDLVVELQRRVLDPESGLGHGQLVAGVLTLWNGIGRSG